jgi:putative peptidoglycan lipid II flippase
MPLLVHSSHQNTQQRSIYLRDTPLELPQPTSLSAATIDLNSAGTIAQIRSSAIATPAKLNDTAELSRPTPLTPGHNVIAVNSSAPTTYLLVWITTLGNSGGKSRSDISEVTVQPR